MVQQQWRAALQRAVDPRRVHLWPFALALAVTLFPFDWLSEVWPAYGDVFDRVFVTARDHAVGHSTLFFLAGLLTLLSLPMLRARPVLYLVLLAPVALGQEALQSLFKGQPPTLGDGRDLLFDLLGWCLAGGIVFLVAWLMRLPRGRAA